MNKEEIEYLSRFSLSRRMIREKGPYYANPGTMFGQEDAPDIKDYNVPPDGQPGLWCQWVPTPDGTALVWDQGEKFYHPAEWMTYLIDHFLKQDALSQGETFPASAGPDQDSYPHNFTYDHVLNGVIDVQGEDSSDRWRLLVENNAVRVVAYPEDLQEASEPDA